VSWPLFGRNGRDVADTILAIDAARGEEDWHYFISKDDYARAGWKQNGPCTYLIHRPAMSLTFDPAEAIPQSLRKLEVTYDDGQSGFVRTREWGRGEPTKEG
jgi:hypothetical protein